MPTNNPLQAGQHGRAASAVDPAREHFDYSFGAVLLADGRARFRVWAPGAKSVDLELHGEAPLSMQACGDGFYEAICACAPGDRYRYRVGDDLSVPDPASRLQDGDVHSDSIIVDAGSYAWQNNEWRGRPWSETVLYEIHPGLAGGFRGVQERLADLAELGVTAIELMPIADFPGPRNWGYDGVLPYAPDCAYGSPDELKLLIDTAHCMGLQVFLDVVYNHFGPDGNYLSAYAAEFFRTDIHTPWGPAIDFRKPQVRAFFAENALYWLSEYRFDGLRFDAVHAISEADWLPEMAQFVRSHIEPGRHVHLVLENDDNTASFLRQGFDAQWNDDAHHVLHHILTGESQGYYAAYADDPTGDLARCLREGFVYQGQPSAWRGGKPRGEPSAALSPTAFVFFLQNHDQTGNRAFGERLSTLCEEKPDALEAVIALQILTPHIPMLFMGEEYGSTAPFLYFTSFTDASLAQAVREGRRNEFAGFPEFSDPAARTNIPDPNDIQTWEDSRALPDRKGPQAKKRRALYKTLLAVRRKLIAPHLEGATSVSTDVIAPLAVVACWRLGNGSLLRVYCNLSERKVDVEAGVSKNQVILFSTNHHADEALRAGVLMPFTTVATAESRATAQPESGDQA